MVQNVGRLDACVRLSTGLLLFGLGLKSRSPARSLLMMALGANKIAEGITRHCPLLYMLGLDTLGPGERDHREPVSASAGYGQLAENPYRVHSGGDTGEGTDDGEYDPYEQGDDSPASRGERGPRRLRFRRPRQPSGLSAR